MDDMEIVSRLSFKTYQIEPCGTDNFYVFYKGKFVLICKIDDDIQSYIEHYECENL